MSATTTIFFSSQDRRGVSESGCVGFSCPLFVPSPFWAADFQEKSPISPQILPVQGFFGLPQLVFLSLFAPVTGDRNIFSWP